MIALEALGIVVCLFWIALDLDRGRAWPVDQRLPAGERDPRASRAPVVAVVPARDEAAMLGQTLPALIRQRSLEAVVVVDDASDDATVEVARRVAAGESGGDRVRVLESSSARSGHAGKVDALERGVAVATEIAPGDDAWLLLTDADIEHRPGSVAALLERANDGFDLVSVMARLRVETVWERLLVPSFVYFFQLLYPFRKVADPSSRVAAAAGGCVLVRRSVLERAGGVAAIRGAVIDDVALARAVAAAGGRLWLGHDAGVRSLRPYPRLADLWSMVARSAYDQLSYRIALLIPVLAGLLLFFVAPPVLFLVGLWAGLAGSLGGGRLALWAIVALALQFRGLLPVVRHQGLSAPHALALPVASALFGAMTMSSAWSHYSGRGVAWRGRRIAKSDE